MSCEAPPLYIFSINNYAKLANYPATYTRL